MYVSRVSLSERKQFMSNVRARRRISSFQIIILGFAGVIFLGALLLMLPVSTRSGVVTPFTDALFTSTSAVCVTGLVVRDTGSYWSTFGQSVIIVLIQIGGLGVITVAAAFSLLSGRKISLRQRSTMQDAISAPQVGGIVRLTRFVIIGTFTVELVGALLLMPSLCSQFGARGVWMSFFHAISAFCNAGFDLFGQVGAEYVSLTVYASSVPVNTVIMLLIVLGGLGFLTWEDICTHRWRVHRYRMQSKVILTVSALLIFLPAVLFFFCDFADRPLGERILCSLFQSVTARTAGFNTADLSAMTGVSHAVLIVLMLIGGSPGSTAGGMKTTTAAVLFANATATFCQRESAHFFGRRIDSTVVKNAATILIMYVTLMLAGGCAVSLIEDLPLSACLFETASAVGTVGVSLGITPSLGLASHMILILLMFLGRVGGLTVIYAAMSGNDTFTAKLPQEKIIVG